jgi:hypothetical protein
LLTQVEQKAIKKPMQTARYHRDHAELCLQMARGMSDPQAADVLRTAAARHFEQAIELEKAQHYPRPDVDTKS